MSAAIPMTLWCPFGHRHIDEGVWAEKIHHTHSCQTCGITWRPAVVPTVGVLFLPGFKNEPAAEVAPLEATPTVSETTAAAAPRVGMSYEETTPPEKGYEIGDRLIKLGNGDAEEYLGEIVDRSPVADRPFLVRPDAPGFLTCWWNASELDRWFRRDPHEARAPATTTSREAAERVVAALNSAPMTGDPGVDYARSVDVTETALRSDVTPPAPKFARRSADPREPTAPLRSGQPPVTTWRDRREGASAIAELRAAISAAPPAPWTKGGLRKLAGLTKGDATRALAVLFELGEVARKGLLYGPAGFTAWPAPKAWKPAVGADPDEEAFDVVGALAESDATAAEEALAHRAEEAVSA